MSSLLQITNEFYKKVSHLNKLTYLIDLSLIVLVSSFSLFYNLGQPKLTPNDETQHILVTQMMLEKGTFINLTTGNLPYYGKPPFKMWLSLIPVTLFGQSAFSFRFLDAALGVLTCLLIYQLALRMFSSRLTGYLAVFLLLGSECYVHLHVARHAVQDSMLVFLTTLSLYIAWRFYSNHTASHSKYAYCRYANSEQAKYSKYDILLISILIGFAFLTKSIAAVIIPLIIICYSLINPNLPLIIKSNYKNIIIALLVMLCIPAPYFVTRCSQNSEMCRGIFATRAIERAANTENPPADLYINNIIYDKLTVPPELLALALLFTLYIFYKERDWRYLYLSFWAVIPVAFYTISKGKLSWYIAPAIPGMSLLTAAFISQVYLFLKRLSQRNLANRASALIVSAYSSICLGILLLSAYQICSYNINCLGKTFNITEKNNLNTFINISKGKHLYSKKRKVILYKLPRLKMKYRVYFNMLKNHALDFNLYKNLKNSKELQNADYSVTLLKNAEQLQHIKKASYYSILAPASGELDSLIAFSYREKEHALFKKFEITNELGRESAPILYGWSEGHPLGDQFVRWITGNEASLYLEADQLHKASTTTISIKAAHPSYAADGPIEIRASLNNTIIGVWNSNSDQITIFEGKAPSKLWKIGKNILTLNLKRNDGQQISDDELLFLVQSIKTSSALSPSKKLE